MKVSPKYKRFKRINFVGDTFTLLDMRSSIIRTIGGYHSHTNTAILWRLKNQTQNIEIDTSKTDRIPTVYDRALFALPYTDMIISGHIARPSVSISHNLILNYLIVFYGLITDHPYNQVFKKPKTYLIIEMIPHLVYYSHERKYHKLSSMFVPGYQCSNVYIIVEKGTLINKDIQ